jgi:asparagine N-glycosylation enzyme membrane subunit Stt3
MQVVALGEVLMVAANSRGVEVARVRIAHPEETLSILMSIGAAIGCVAFFWIAPDFSPTSQVAWAVPGWIAGTYLVVQMLFLLVSATQIRALGVLDSVLSILPVVTGLVTVVEWIVGHLPLSLFQLNVLSLLIAASVAEFLLTIWIRFVINRRTIGFGMS